MPRPISLAAKTPQSPPSPATGQSIVKKVAKTALLLLFFPVTLIRFAAGLIKTIVRWVKGAPSNPAEQRWQMIKTFFAKEEGEYPIEMPADHLVVLKQHPDFLPAIVELLDDRGFTPNEKNEIIKAALEAYRIAWDVGDPEGILKSLTAYLSAVRTLKILTNGYFEKCIKSLLKHGLDQHRGDLCIDDCFEDCPDTKFAARCIDVYLEGLNDFVKNCYSKS